MEYQAQLEQALAKLGSQVDGKIQAANAMAEEKIGAKFMGELKDLAAKFKETQDELTSLAQKSAVQAKASVKKTMGQAFSESDPWKSFQMGASSKARFEFQANTITGETASTPVDTITPFGRMAGIVPGATRQLTILDFIPQGNTNEAAVEYTREASFVNNAAETAQAATKPESDMTFGLNTAPVATISHCIPVSKQVLSDAPMLSSYIDGRMAYGVRLKLEQQILNGNGTAPNLRGILAAGNSTVVAVGDDTNAFDYTNSLKARVEVAEYIPDFYFVNPLDWSAIEKIKKSTGDASYVGADGAVNYINNGLQPLLWGLPVIKSNSVPAGTVIAGSRDAMMLWNRQGVTIDVSESDGNNFRTGLLTVRAEMRAAFTVFTPAALVRANLATLP